MTIYVNELMDVAKLNAMSICYSRYQSKEPIFPDLTLFLIRKMYGFLPDRLPDSNVAFFIIGRSENIKTQNVI
jgi:hypothetical protein